MVFRKIILTSLKPAFEFFPSSQYNFKIMAVLERAPILEATPMDSRRVGIAVSQLFTPSHCRKPYSAEPPLSIPELATQISWQNQTENYQQMLYPRFRKLAAAAEGRGLSLGDESLKGNKLPDSELFILGKHPYIRIESWDQKVFYAGLLTASHWDTFRPVSVVHTYLEGEDPVPVLHEAVIALDENYAQRLGRDKILHSPYIPSSSEQENLNQVYSLFERYLPVS